MLLQQAACPTVPQAAQHGPSTLSPQLRWVPCFRTLGPGIDRSRGLHTWGRHSLTQASPAPRVANWPPLWALFNAAGSGETEELCVCTASWENQWQPGAGNVFWVSGCRFSSVTLCTPSKGRRRPLKDVCLSLPHSRQD